MADSKAVIAVVLGAAGLAGCASLEGVRASLRQPGEINLELPEAVVEEYHCAKRPLPFVEVEAYEVIPERVKPGAVLSHRTLYVMCPRNRTEVIAGTLTTRVLFKGRVIVTDAEPHELKPGRWRKDQSVQLPASAGAGVYSLDLEFTPQLAAEVGPAHFLRQRSFIVLSDD